MATIVVDNITYTYGAHSPFEKHAIRGVSMELRPGELLGTRQHGEALVAGGAAAYGSMQLLYEAAQCAERLSTDPDRAQTWLAITQQAQRLISRLSERVSIS